ncbi:uncharacterized protein LOC108904401 [Anoplophora glabripennis]|uniref:uncharacterized protein LOC108904401 n=1 Tax=Anoplophora glabripennis TaxID=217634 RepID=UPI00087371BF|nr:uncharacterized protein LOC108904401 [Anoplophora glabripennis]
MKLGILFKLAIIGGCFSNIFCEISYDYYWRDYTGDIPGDAVEGGRDVNNRKTYIGQVFVKNYGIIPVTIYPGKTSVAANIDGIHHISSYVKILCSSCKENFKWLPADAKTLHVKMINKHLVKGGVEWEGKVTNIGRILYQSELLVAKVCGYAVGDAKLFFPAGNQEKTAETYEVLVYDGPDLFSIEPRIQNFS